MTTNRGFVSDAEHERIELWWKRHELDLKKDVALIPSDECRGMLTAVSLGIASGHGLSSYSHYSWSRSAAVQKASDLGFEIVSAWLRDQQELSPGMRDRVAELRAALDTMNIAVMAEMQQAFDDPGGPI